MKIGLVLSGGLARGVAQLGFITSFLKHVPREYISIISSSSVGALTGMAIATNKIDDLSNTYLKFDFDNLISFVKSVKNHLFFNVVDSVFSKDSRLDIPLYITGSNIINKTVQYFYADSNSSWEEVKKICNISCTFPFVNGLFKKYNNQYFLDGGFYDNIPTYPLKYHDLDLIIICHCASNYIPPSGMIQSNVPVLDVHVTSKRHKYLRTFSFQNHNLHNMYNIGYELGDEVGKKISVCRNKEELFTACRDFIHENIVYYQHSHNSNTLVETVNRIFRSKFESNINN